MGLDGVKGGEELRNVDTVEWGPVMRAGHGGAPSKVWVRSVGRTSTPQTLGIPPSPDLPRTRDSEKVSEGRLDIEPVMTKHRHSPDRKAFPDAADESTMRPKLGSSASIPHLVI
jgi:hypothetical protein